MKTLRSYTIKICVIALLATGLGMMMVQPAEASRSNQDFTVWLHSIVKKAHATGLDQKLAQLQKSDSNIDQLIVQASQIVSRNNNDFNLPSASATDNMYQIILVEWNQFQTTNAMAAVPLVHSAKPMVTQLHPKDVWGSHRAGFLSQKNTFILSGFYDVDHAHQQRIPSLIPLIGGIAIGAP